MSLPILALIHICWLKVARGVLHEGLCQIPVLCVQCLLLGPLCEIVKIITVSASPE